MFHSSWDLHFFSDTFQMTLHAYCTYSQGGRDSSSAGNSNLWFFADLSGMDGSRVVARWHRGRIEQFSLALMCAWFTGALLTSSEMSPSWVELGKMPHALPTAVEEFKIPVSPSVLYYYIILLSKNLVHLEIKKFQTKISVSCGFEVQLLRCFCIRKTGYKWLSS